MHPGQCLGEVHAHQERSGEARPVRDRDPGDAPPSRIPGSCPGLPRGPASIQRTWARAATSDDPPGCSVHGHLGRHDVGKGSVDPVPGGRCRFHLMTTRSRGSAGRSPGLRVRPRWSPVPRRGRPAGARSAPPWTSDNGSVVMIRASSWSSLVRARPHADRLEPVLLVQASGRQVGQPDFKRHLAWPTVANATSNELEQEPLADAAAVARQDRSQRS